MSADQLDGELAKRLIHWATSDHTLNLTLTTEKPPNRVGWATTARDTRSRLPLQKKLKARVLSSLRTHAGTCTRDAIYQTRERARALITRALPRKVGWRCLQEARTFSTAVMRGLQFASSRLPTPIKTPRTLILEEDQSRLTGGSRRPFQELGLWTSIEYVSKEALMASSDVTMSDVSSAYWEMGGSGSWMPGRERPPILWLARMLTARTCMFIYFFHCNLLVWLFRLD